MYLCLCGLRGLCGSTMNSAREKALRYLSHFSRTEQQVTRYLTRKGFSREEVSDALSFLLKHRFLNDPAFAESFIQSKIQHRDGPLKIRQMLLQKGIDSKTANRLLQEHYPSELQLENVIALLQKRVEARHASPLQGKDRERLIRFVASRGFTRYVIIQAFKELTTDKHR